MVVGRLIETARGNYVVVGAPEILNLRRERTVKIMRGVIGGGERERERERERDQYILTQSIVERFLRDFL